MNSETPFIHLHCHSEYSIHDSILRIKELVQCAKNNKMNALALTDRNNLYAAIKFYKAARAAGIKPIIGCDLSIRDETGVRQLLLLAKNHEGFKRLSTLVSDIYAHDQHHGVLALNWQRLNPDSCRDLIALSGGHESDIAYFLAQNQEEKALQRARHWQEVFDGNYYFQATALGWAQEALLLQAYHRWGSALGIATVASNCVCFAQPDDFTLHEVRTCIGSGDVLDNPQRPQLYTAEYYFKSASQLAMQLPPVLLENAAQIAEQCNLILPLGKSFLPDFPLPEGVSVNDYLTEQSLAGLKKRLQDLFPDLSSDDFQAQEALYRERLQIELQVIQNMGFAGYFLIVADFIQWAKQQNIPVGPGRGSGAGSLVAYSLGITDLNPLPYDLLFERFLNPERVSMPDFDIDFCMDRRDEVIHYVAERYGAHRVAQIATHGTMAAKAVIRDVGRVLGLPYPVVNRLSKMIPKAVSIDLEDVLGRSRRVQENEEMKALISPEFIAEYESNSESRHLIDIALRLEGLTRNVGKHAGGVVIAPSTLTDFSALYADAAGSALATQFDKDDIEAAGLVKFDFLGLRTLTIIDWAVKNIHRRGIDLRLEALPLDDEATYKLLQKAQTTAVFQLESSGIKRLAERLKPDHFEDIISLVALYRPGPLKAGMVDDFVKRKHGLEPIRYEHPLLEPILKTTYGVMVYQEQVMQVAQALANYTLGGADELRRAMGKKKADEMARHRSIFIQGAVANQIDEALAGSIFDAMAKFAEYGFNKSHSAAYALLTYQTAWLKTHYPAEFMAAVMTADIEHSDKIVRNLEECRQLKLKILPPCVNHSQFAFSVDEEGAVRFGLGAVKGIGEAAIQMLTAERQKNGAFQSLADLCRRVDLKKLNRKTLETLIYSGAFDGLESNRGGLMALLPQAMTLAEQHHRNQQNQQNDMFGFFEDEAQAAPILQVRAEEAWSQKTQLQNEKQVLGLYLTDHPVNSHKALLEALCDFDLAELRERQQDWKENERHELMVGGLVVDQKKIISKKGRPMLFITLDDRSDQQELTWFVENDNEEALAAVDNVLLARVKAQYVHYRGQWQFSIQECFSVQEARWRWAKRLNLNIKHSAHPDYPLQLQKVLTPAANDAGVVVHLNISADDIGARGRLVLRQRCLMNQETLQNLEALLGANNVALDY